MIQHQALVKLRKEFKFVLTNNPLDIASLRDFFESRTENKYFSRRHQDLCSFLKLLDSKRILMNACCTCVPKSASSLSFFSGAH